MFNRIFLMMILFASGCSLNGNAVINARTDNGVGHAFISTEESYNSLRTTNQASMVFFFVPLIITFPLTVLDVGIALVADTVMLPIDLIVEPDNEQREVSARNIHM